MKLRKLWSYIEEDTKVKIILSNEDAIFLRSGAMIEALSDAILGMEVGKIKTDSYEEELQIELKEISEVKVTRKTYKLEEEEE